MVLDLCAASSHGDVRALWGDRCGLGLCRTGLRVAEGGDRKAALGETPGPGRCGEVPPLPYPWRGGLEKADSSGFKGERNVGPQTQFSEEAGVLAGAWDEGRRTGRVGSGPFRIEEEVRMNLRRPWSTYDWRDTTGELPRASREW